MANNDQDYDEEIDRDEEETRAGSAQSESEELEAGFEGDAEVDADLTAEGDTEESASDFAGDPVHEGADLPVAVPGAEGDEGLTLEGALPLVEGLSLEAQIEAIIFAAPKPMQPAEVIEIVGPSLGLKEAEHILDALVEVYRLKGGGFQLEYIKGMGYQFRSVPAAAPLMERLFASRPRPISRAALETLSIIAYRQPVTRADIEFVRGVDAGSIIKNLLERNLICCVGRKEDSGRPMLFGTTQEFLKIFRLNSLSDLPPLQAFQPAADTMTAAFEQLSQNNPVDVEGFVGDSEMDQPEVSQGLIDAQPADERQGASAFQSDDETEQLAETQEVEDEEEDFNERADTDSEVAIPNGDSFTPPSGELDPSEEDKG